MTIVSRTSHPVALLVDEVLRLTPRFRSIFGRAPAGVDLTGMEITVLVATVEAERAPTVPQIGRSLGHPRQVIQRAANALIARDLVRTETNPDHKRAPLLVPTAAGRALKATVDGNMQREIDAIEALLPPGDYARLGEALRTLRHRIEDHVRGRDTDDRA